LGGRSAEEPVNLAGDLYCPVERPPLDDCLNRIFPKLEAVFDYIPNAGFVIEVEGEPRVSGIARTNLRSSSVSASLEILRSKMAEFQTSNVGDESDDAIVDQLEPDQEQDGVRCDS
jgi:hypothetical protein